MGAVEASGGTDNVSESPSSLIVYADKTVLKLSGLEIKGLNTSELEKLISDRLQCMVRVIGVTGKSIDMDLYGISPDDIYRQEDGLWQAISLCDGINATEVASISGNRRITEVDWSDVPETPGSACLMERVMEMSSHSKTRHMES